MTIKEEEAQANRGFSMQSQLTASGSSTPQHTLVFDLFFIFFLFTAVELNLGPQAVSALNSTHPIPLLAFLLAVGVSCWHFRESQRMMGNLGVWAEVAIDCSAAASLSLSQAMGRLWFWGVICDSGGGCGLNPSIFC
jgi:hypothetical protein